MWRLLRPLRDGIPVVPAAITVPAASAVQDPETGVWTVRPGSATLQITGTI